MNGADRLEQALKVLRDADSARAASHVASARVRAAFRQHHARRRSRVRWQWAAAVAACICVGLFAFWRIDTSAPVAPPPPAVAVAPPPANVVAAPVTVSTAPPVTPKKVASKVARMAKPKPAPRPDVEAPATSREFVALPYAPPFRPRDFGQVMRVRLPRQSLRLLGVPVNEERLSERVPADLLFGEDGVPRAIRLTGAH